MRSRDEIVIERELKNEFAAIGRAFVLPLGTGMVERGRNSKDELFLIYGRLWTLLQRLAIPDHALAREICKFKILG